MEIEKLASTLRRAVNSGTLSGLFIDPQKAFHCPETAPAFEKAAQLARTLRSTNIASEFFAWPKKTPALNGRSVSGKAHSFTLEKDDAFTVCIPKGYETVHIKPGFSVRTNTAFKSAMDQERTPVYIVAGVLAQACIKHSLRDIMNAHSRAQIILAHDATDLNAQTPEDYIRAVLDNTNLETQSPARIQTASVATIAAITHNIT